MGKTYTSAKGQPVDMERLVMKNETTPAVGNLKVNARGDELGPGGQVIRSREEIIQDYYRTHQGSAAQYAKRATADIDAEVAAPSKKSTRKNVKSSDVDRGVDE